MILICNVLSEWILFICVPLFWESVNPSFPRMSRPIRFTVFASTTSISLLVATRCPELRFIWIVLCDWDLDVVETSVFCLASVRVSPFSGFALLEYLFCFGFADKASWAACIC